MTDGGRKCQFPAMKWCGCHSGSNTGPRNGEIGPHNKQDQVCLHMHIGRLLPGKGWSKLHLPGSTKQIQRSPVCLDMTILICCKYQPPNSGNNRIKMPCGSLMFFQEWHHPFPIWQQRNEEKSVKVQTLVFVIIYEDCIGALAGLNVSRFVSYPFLMPRRMHWARMYGSCRALPYIVYSLGI